MKKAASIVLSVIVAAAMAGLAYYALLDRYHAVAGLDNGGGEFVYEGGSLIVAPNGHILADPGNREGVFLADLDWDLLQSIRQRNNIFSDRRPILDEIDDSQI